MAAVSIEYGTLAIEVGFVFNFVDVFSPTFPFPPITNKIFGDWHVIRQGALNRFF
jgi:hypothetical protein